LAVITGACVASSVFLLLNLESLSWWHLLTVPLAFVVSNFVEYVAHRWPMHRPTIFGKHIYKKHAAIHHRYFTYEDMVLEESKDLYEILSNPRHIVAFLVLSIIPVSALLCLLSWNLGFLFAATAILYYLAYEWIHLASHMPPEHWIPSLPVLRSLCDHHRKHHDTRRMREANFNIAFPLFDRLFGTRI